MNEDYTDNNIYEIRNNFILYVGHREGYKNFEAMLPILQNIIKTENIILKVVGPACTKQEKSVIRKYNLENNIEFYTKVSDDKLKDLYLNCLALIYPSLYEGFGYPLIESMYYGAIPIALNIASIPEVLGNAGIIVKSDKINEIEYEIKTLLNDLPKRTSLKFKSIQRAKYFSIKKNISKTLKVYEKALGI
jgi:glycosyltransferase involved in cell wall biosynthesis